MNSAASERRILLVEDDEMHAELIRRAFEDQPAIILTVAHRLGEAVQALQQHMPDMVIADLRLPDGRGIELCHRTDFPIVIMTSQGSEADAVEAMRAGALDYIVKSDLMFSEMPHVVDRALREWTLTKAHDRANRQLHAQYEIASALATSRTLEEAGPRLLQSICRCVDWPVGELWRVDEQTEVLHREASWALEPALEESMAQSDAPAFARGEGVPGATWDKGEPLTVSTPEELAPACMRPEIMAMGLRCAYGFPVHTSDGHTFAVFTFFARDLHAPNGDIDRLMMTVSAQLNVFAERQREQEERRRLQRELLERERLVVAGETAATLAHEIGNPLNVMYMHAQLLQRRLERLPGLDRKITEGVDMLLGENLRLAELLQDFRMMSHRGMARLQPIDLGPLLDLLLSLQQPALDSGSIALEREIPSELPFVMGDEAKLKQVFMNLVKNAIEAMPEGGQLTVRITLESQRLVVEITDTGVGLPEGVDVFEPFQTTKASGTGLGLAVARQVLAAHEGTITCRSAPSSGTTFSVVLPVRSGDVDEPG